MAFHKIPNTTINGKAKMFGGSIYDINIDVGLAEQATTITISLVNESGEFIRPSLKPITYYNINIGNIYKESCALISWKLRRSSAGRILELKFQDGSLALDQLNVGLKNKFGTQEAPGLILVGREMHPCDFNENGYFDSNDAIKLAMSDVDPCEIRCPGDIPERQNIVENCAKREITDIFDVKYTFEDLLDAIEGKTPTVSNVDRSISFVRPGDDGPGNQIFTANLPPIEPIAKKNNKKIKIVKRPSKINISYFSNYTGSLRSVLKNWCADFGWTFYWEDGGLNFIDVKERPKINFRQYDNLESTVEEETLEGTVSRGFISHYAEPGILAEQECSESKPYMLRCLNLKDLYGEYYKPSWNAIAINDKNNRQISTSEVTEIELAQPDKDNTNNVNIYLDQFYTEGVPIQTFEKMCALSFYSNELRNLYMFLGYYGIINVAAAEAAKNKWMDRFGQRKILRVFSKESSDDNDAKLFSENLVNGTLPGNGDSKIVSDETLKRIQNWNGYFIVTGQNSNLRGQSKDLLDAQFEIEENLATDFIGKHWIRSFAASYHGANPQIEPAGEYIAALSKNIEDIPFAQFRHTYKSNVSKIVNSFTAVEQRQDYNSYGMKKYIRGNIVNKTSNRKNIRSMIYVQRQDASSRWNPIKNAETSLSAIKNLNQFAPEKINLPDNTALIKSLVSVDGKFITGIKESDLPFIELWVVYPGQFDMDVSLNENVYEEKPSKTENLGAYSLLTYGLMSRQAAVYNLKASMAKNINLDKTKNLVSITFPAGGSVLHDEDIGISGSRKVSFNKRWATSGVDFSLPGYKVLVTESSKNRGVIPKHESSLVIPAPSLDVLSVEYQIEEISKETAIKYLNNLTVDCRIPDSEIARLHLAISKNLNYSVEEPFLSKEYSIYGLELPDKVNIKNGLESINIRVDSKGIYTVMRIGNSLFVPPSREFSLKQLETFLPAVLYNSRKNLL